MCTNTRTPKTGAQLRIALRMAFLHICFKGDVCISHEALTHFAHRHTHVIPGSSICMYHMSVVFTCISAVRTLVC